MRIGIDVRCLNNSHVRGMGKYVSSILSNIAPGGAVDWQYFSNRPDLPLHLPDGAHGVRNIRDAPGYRFHGWEQVVLPWQARKARLDVLHCTGTTLPLWQPVPTVVTVHDTLMWDESVDRGYQRFYMEVILPKALARAAAVITISESSRNDILNRWPRLAGKIAVIPHGIDDHYFAQVPATRHAMIEDVAGDRPYVLYVGGSLERKRFAWAVEVFDSARLPDTMLLACGFGGAERQAFESQVPEHLRPCVKALPFIPEDVMPGLYFHAAAVLYPTLYEGFGFPALEAQAVGTPTLFSKLGSLAELVGPLARILPPNDLEAWVRQTREALQSLTPVESRRAAGRKWASGFSWQQSASEHLRVYRAAARMEHFTT